MLPADLREHLADVDRPADRHGNRQTTEQRERADQHPRPDRQPWDVHRVASEVTGNPLARLSGNAMDPRNISSSARTVTPRMMTGSFSSTRANPKFSSRSPIASRTVLS